MIKNKTVTREIQVRVFECEFCHQEYEIQSIHFNHARDECSVCGRDLCRACKTMYEDDILCPACSKVQKTFEKRLEKAREALNKLEEKWREKAREKMYDI
jgi:hypothetical protein